MLSVDDYHKYRKRTVITQTKNENNVCLNICFTGKMYAVIGRRHGKILSADLTEGSGTFMVKAVLPVIESYNFAQEIRKQTSGLAYPQLMFSHWEVSIKRRRKKKFIYLSSLFAFRYQFDYFLQQSLEFHLFLFFSRFSNIYRRLILIRIGFRRLRRNICILVISPTHKIVPNCTWIRCASERASSWKNTLLKTLKNKELFQKINKTSLDFVTTFFLF